MKKNNKLLIGLLTIVILAVIGLSAYAYQKQQALNSNKPKVENKKEDSKLEKLIKETVSKFNKENLNQFLIKRMKLQKRTKIN